MRRGIRRFQSFSQPSSLFPLSQYVSRHVAPSPSFSPARPNPRNRDLATIQRFFFEPLRSRANRAVLFD